MKCFLRACRRYENQGRSSRSRESLLSPPFPPITRRSIHLGAVCALTVPNRCNAECYRPICRVLVDRGISVVAELVAIVLERLSERAQHGPCLVTGRTRHSVFARECG